MANGYVSPFGRLHPQAKFPPIANANSQGSQRKVSPAQLPPINPDLIETYLAGQISKQTQRIYRADLKGFLLCLNLPGTFDSPEAMIRNLLAVDRKYIIAWRDELLSQGYAPGTIARKMSVIGNIYKLLKSEGLIVSNPFDWVKKPKVSAEGKTPAFSKEQAEQLLALPDMATKMGQRDRILLMLLFFCGLRRSEVVKVQPQDFVIDQGYIVLKIHGKGRSGKDQKVKIPPVVYNAVTTYVKQWHLVPDEYLFTGQCHNPRYCKSHRPITDSRVYLIIKSYCRKAGIDATAFSPHSARASTITFALKGGATIYQTQQLARHCSPNTTLKYDRNRMSLENNAVDYIHLDVKPLVQQEK